MKVRACLMAALVLATACGVLALAAEYGTDSDPLVSLSYINGVLKPDILRETDDKITSKASSVNSAVAASDARISAALNGFMDRNTAQVTDAMKNEIAKKVVASVPQNAKPAPFLSVTLAKGKSYALKPGSEIVLRSGSAKASGALIDVTTGGSGSTLAANHLYLAPDGGSVKAAAPATLLIRNP
ncbi:MAG: hypothetical protein RSC43_06805 [Clostridia bacterium]